MAKEQGSFSLDDVLDRLSTKLVDRHPHVFGDVKADTSAEVLRNWEALKEEERKKKSSATRDNVAQDRLPEQARKAHDDRHSVLAGVSSATPSLLEAYKLSSRAAQVGFDWPNIDGLFDKLNEETEELRQQLGEYPAPGPRPQGRGIASSGRSSVSEALRRRLEEGVGDLVFVLADSARCLSSDPGPALPRTHA